MEIMLKRYKQSINCIVSAWANFLRMAISARMLANFPTKVWDEKSAYNLAPVMKRSYVRLRRM